MCNLYSITKGQAAIIAFTRAMRDTTGNLPPLPGIFPDYLAPVVRNAPDGVRELSMLRWGMPGPPAFGGAPITNIRNTKSSHWRRWLKPENRCVVPFTSFCEYAETKPKKTPTWFALDKERPLAVFAGIWTAGTVHAAPRRIPLRANIICSNFDPAVSLVSINPECSHDYPPRDARALASCGLSLLLALEVGFAGRAAVD
jgi:putative SOS response-associated peptidase YedK